MTAAEYAQGLRDYADWIEEHAADLPPSFLNSPVTVYRYTSNKSALADFVRLMGRGEKSADETYMRVVREFGPIQLQAYANRANVCEKKLVMREVEEWVCDDSIFATSVGGAEEQATS